MLKTGLKVTLFGLVLSFPIAYAQTPSGLITGTVSDASGSVLPNVQVTVTSRDSGATREMKTGADGAYSTPSLSAGNNEDKAEAAEFRSMIRPAQVTTGTSTTINIVMQVGTARDIIVVEEAPVNITYDSNTVQGAVLRQ